jgi:putative transposase
MRSDLPLRKTCERWNESGHAHFLTFSCFQRRPFLSKDRSREWLVNAIEQARSKHRFHLWAYVIMPEHVHLLIWPTLPNYSISSLLKTIKQSVSFKALDFVNKEAPGFLAQMRDAQPDGAVTHRFWQRGGGYDRNITEPKTIWSTMEYIHANPVRRELCRYAAEWPWSSFQEWERPGAGPLKIDRESMPRTEAG